MLHKLGGSPLTLSFFVPELSANHMHNEVAGALGNPEDSFWRPELARSTAQVREGTLKSGTPGRTPSNPLGNWAVLREARRSAFGVRSWPGVSLK